MTWTRAGIESNEPSRDIDFRIKFRSDAQRSCGSLVPDSGGEPAILPLHLIVKAGPENRPHHIASFVGPERLCTSPMRSPSVLQRVIEQLGEPCAGDAGLHLRQVPRLRIVVGRQSERAGIEPDLVRIDELL